MPSLRARSLMELVTVTRATTATYCGADGLLALAAAGVARIDHDPVTRLSRGLLVEEARTNLLLRSEEFDNATWVKTGVTCAGAAINARAAPDGLVTMDKFEEDASSGNHYATQTYTKISSSEVQAYALSCWAVAAERTWIRLLAQGSSGSAHSVYADFDLVDGAAGTPVIAGNYDSALAWVEPWGGGLFRVVLVFRVNNDGQATIQNFALLLSPGAGGSFYTGSVGSGLYLWGAQLEKGPFPSSYIPTTTATVARNADDIRMASLSPWLEEEAVGTMVAEYSLPWMYSALDPSTRLIVDINSGSSNRHFVGIAGGKSRGESISGGVVVATDPAQVNQPARTVAGRVGWAWAKDSFGFAIDGAIRHLDSAGDVPATLTAAQLGAGINGSVDHLCGHLRRIRFYPRRVSNTELQQLTKAA